MEAAARFEAGGGRGHVDGHTGANEDGAGRHNLHLTPGKAGSKPQRYLSNESVPFQRLALSLTVVASLTREVLNGCHLFCKPRACDPGHADL